MTYIIQICVKNSFTEKEREVVSKSFHSGTQKNRNSSKLGFLVHSPISSALHRVQYTDLHKVHYFQNISLQLKQGRTLSG